jgi:EmrB/QacA subfamily drug resistance transporter
VASGIPLALALVVAGTRFMEILDGTILANAAPVMARSVHVSPLYLSLAMTGYLLAVAVTLPASGQLAARFGTKRTFLGAIAGFTVASALCAAAQNLPELTVTRALQGVAGALMVPVGRLAVFRNASRGGMLAAVAYLTWPGLLAPVLAPVVGGGIVSVTSWRWIFLINLPLGVIALLAAAKVVPRDPASGSRPGPLDRMGFLLTGTALAALIVAGESIAVDQARLLVPSAVVALGSGALAVRHLRRKESPLLDLGVFGYPAFRVSNAVGCAYRATVEAAPYVLPLMLQQGWGWRPSRAGVALMALFAGNLLIKPITTPLLRRMSFRTVILGSTVIGGAAFVGCATLGPDLPVAAVFGVLFVSGAARSVGFTAYFTLSFVDVPRDRIPAANTLSATVQQIGSTLGVVVGAIAIQAGTLLPGGALGAPTPYRAAFAALAAALLLTLPSAMRLPLAAGEAARGRQPVGERA